MLETVFDSTASVNTCDSMRLFCSLKIQCSACSAGLLDSGFRRNDAGNQRFCSACRRKPASRVGPKTQAC